MKLKNIEAESFGDQMKQLFDSMNSLSNKKYVEDKFAFKEISDQDKYWLIA